MPEAGAVKMNFHTVAASIVGDSLYLVLRDNRAVQSVFKSDDLRRRTDWK
jgi:hypothetical protein